VRPRARAALAGVLFVALVASRAGAATKAVLTLHWYPQTQFAGYYMALAKGFYAARGIDLEIRRGGSDVDSIRELREGRTDFATLFLTAGILYRADDLRLVNVVQVVNRGNLLIVARRDRGVSKIADLDGRRMSLWGDHFSAAFKKAFADSGIWPVLFDQFSSVELFLRGGVDACCAMSYNEYQRILLAGRSPEELTVISLADEGYDIPEDGVYCVEETWRKDPELARDLGEATMEGWRYAAEHPEEAVDLVLAEADRAGYTVNRVLLRRMLDGILPSILADGSWRTPGVLSREDYERAAGLVRSVFVEAGESAPYEAFRPLESGR
jgi:NitT/TauT family transport system substrate-binding protein